MYFNKKLFFFKAFLKAQVFSPFKQPPQTSSVSPTWLSSHILSLGPFTGRSSWCPGFGVHWNHPGSLLSQDAGLIPREPGFVGLEQGPGIWFPNSQVTPLPPVLEPHGSTENHLHLLSPFPASPSSPPSCSPFPKPQRNLWFPDFLIFLDQ